MPIRHRPIKRHFVRSRRDGFTAIEMVVVLAVLAILAAVIARNVVGTVNSGRSAALAESLDALRQSVYAYRADVRRYPTQLAYLSTQPGSASDVCGRTVPPAFLAEWRGPYTAQMITASGLQVGDASILNGVEVVATAPAPAPGIETPATLYIVVEDVDLAVAEDLEKAFDSETISASSYTTGTILWEDTGTAGDASGTLRFGLSIRGC